MANPLGRAVVTDEGKSLLAEALAGGEAVIPKFYRFSQEHYEADSSMVSSDISLFWKEKDVDLYQMVDANTIELVLITEATDADFFVYTIGIYLEDGTLFAVANPTYPIASAQRQVAKIQLSYADIGEALNFLYLPHQETEQDISLLNTIAVHGNQITKNTLDIQGIIIQGINQ